MGVLEIAAAVPHSAVLQRYVELDTFVPISTRPDHSVIFTGPGIARRPSDVREPAPGVDGWCSRRC
jgi:hypothetical protein